MRSSSASSSTIGRPGESATTAAVRSSAVGPSPPLVMIRSSPARPGTQRGAHVLGAVADDQDVRESTPASRSRSDSHGPLRSRMIPESTSVPVTTMPARGAHAVQFGRRVAGSRAAPARAQLVADRAVGSAHA